MPDALGADTLAFPSASVAICRVENQQFVPRYCAYMITYYAPDPLQLRLQQYGVTEALAYLNVNRLRTLFWRTYEAVQHPIVYDLAAWVAPGRLLWLDLTKAEQPLVSGPAEAFPYQSIAGDRKHQVLRDGVWKLLY